MQIATELQKVMAVKTPNVTEAELRRLLREAIEARKEADKCARIAGQTLGKAQEHVCEAGERATALKAAMTDGPPTPPPRMPAQRPSWPP